MKAVLGIGTNIGDRKANIEAALEALDRVPGVKVINSSAIYETEPVGYADQQNFYNICAEVESQLSAHALLGACLGIEAGLGRVRKIKNGPRIIDLDLLLCEGFECKSTELTVPHPRMSERAFVLVPLSDILVENNIYGFDIKTALDKTGTDGVIKL